MDKSQADALGNQSDSIAQHSTVDSGQTGVSSGRVVFAASDPEYGRELWISDGTSQGTSLLKDIQPLDSSNPGHLVRLSDGLVLFSANDGPGTSDDTHGFELWRTDGSESGTVLVKDIDPHSERGSQPASITPLGDGQAVFSATQTAGSGRELWVTDGTQEGTSLVKNLRPGTDNDGQPLSSNPQDFMALGNGHVLFTALDSDKGRSLWSTDGTAEGTHRLIEADTGFQLVRTGSATGSEPTAMGSGKALFTAIEPEPAIWTTDGTPSGTRVVQEVEEVTVEGSKDQSQLLQGGVVYDWHAGWATDGTSEGTWRLGGASQEAPDPVYFNNWDNIHSGPVEGPLQDVEANDSRLREVPPIELSDGTLLYEASAVEGHPDYWRFDGPEEYDYYNREWSLLWTTDGTHGGTQLVTDPYDDTLKVAKSWDPVPEFFNLGNDRILYHARGEGLFNESLAVTDGTSQGTEIITSEVSYADTFVPFYDNVWLFNGHRDGIWRTDGTATGTERLVADAWLNQDWFVELEDNRWLIEAEFYESYFGDFIKSELWITDGTPSGTGSVMDNLPGGTYIHDTVLLDNQEYLLSVEYTDPREIHSLYRLDADTFELERIQGAEEGSAASFYGFAKIDEPVQESIISDQISLEFNVETLSLDDYFSSILGSELSYQVSAMPEGMLFDAETGTITTDEDIGPGEHTISVESSNVEGDSVTDEFDWTVVDTGQLRIDSTGDWGRPHEDGSIISEEGSTIHVGHKDGSDWLFRLEQGRMIIREDILEVTGGGLWSGGVEFDAPLMAGDSGFEVNMQTLEVTGFEDDNSEDSARLVGDTIQMKFSDMEIEPEGLSLETDLLFGGSFVTLDTQDAPLLLSTSPQGPMFSPRIDGVGTGRWFKDDDALNLSVPGGSLSLELSNFGVYYDAVEDTFDFSGKAELSWGGKVQDQFRVIGVDTARSMELDLAGDAVDDDAGLFTRGENFLRFSPGSEEEPWSWDVSGSISYSAKSVPGYVETTRPLISELGLELDTTESSFGGNIKGQAPFLASGVELEIELGAFWDPIELEKLKLGLDGLNAPLGSTPFFIQGGELGVDGLSGRDEESALSYQGRIKTTLGPDTTVTPSPLHGSLGGEFTTGDIGLDFKIDSKVGYFVPGVVQSFTDPLVRWFGVNPARINDFTLLEATGDIEYDLAYGDIQTSLGIELLEGVVSAQAQLELYTRGDISHVDASMVATLHMPEAVPLIGGRGTSGTAMLEYVGDGNGQNSSVAAWRTIDLPFGLKTGVGLRADFAGNVELLGQRQIEEIGSWELHEDLSVVVLTARWEEAATDRTLELITPDETVLGEAEWSDHEDIVLVQELSDDYGRAVALQNPARGTWDLRLSDESGLGEVTYDASEMFQGPSTEILSVEVDAGSDQVHIVFDTELQDADSGVVQLYASLSPETVDELGRRITTDAIEVVQGQQEYVWDYREMAPGTYYVNAVTTAEGLAPDHAFSDEPVEVVGSADLVLSVEQEKGPIEETFLLTFTVSNEGERDSGSGILSIDVPESLVGNQPDSEFQSFTDKVTEVNFENIAAGDSADFEFLIPADFEDPAAPLQAQVQAAAYDADPSRNQILYGLFPASEEEQDDDDDPLLQDFEFHTQVDIAVGSPFSELFTDVQAMYTHYQVWTGRIEDGIVLDGNSTGWISAEHLADYRVGYENLEHNTLYVQGWKQGAPPGDWHSNAWRDGDYFDFPGPPGIEFNVDSDISVGTSFSQLFTDQDDTTTWYQLWTGELDQDGVVQGSLVDTQSGGGWVRAEDLNGLQVTGDQAGHNTIYVQAYSPELGMRDWQSNEWQNQEYFGFPEPWGYELAAQQKQIVHLDDGSKGNVADLPVAVADYVNSGDSGSLALQGVQDEQDSGDLFS
ncbi:putative Ig domain-containing protein [Desulfonatronospira thiodismutans]|uniref:putative Ig domain-containing protein n=1 Tax=Desulfonatronospira thiodismutans TaxID=488939 RepID=UPI000319D5F9|nr:putative Ig domain-containing protein [Desulfonatronospira thiodismutans]